MSLFEPPGKWMARSLSLGTTPSDVVHRENKMRVLAYRAPKKKHATPVLMIPSLINRYYVLDLLPGRSLVGYLLERGHAVYMIDWGTAEDEDRYLGLDTFCGRYIGRAVRTVCRREGVEAAHLLGYCMGGTLAAIHTAAYPERVASLTALAAPIRFEGSGLLAEWTRNRRFDVASVVDAFGNLPWTLMQASFHMLRPTMNLRKLLDLAERATNDEFMEGFLAVEAWSNDNVSFPGRAYQDYVERLYRGDLLVRGEYRLDGLEAKLEKIRCPTLAVTFGHDHIVPRESARVLLDRVGASRREELHLPGGHVGAVVSRRAVSRLWPALSNWWMEHETPARPVLVATQQNL